MQTLKMTYADTNKSMQTVKIEYVALRTQTPKRLGVFKPCCVYRSYTLVSSVDFKYPASSCFSVGIDFV